MISIKNLNYSYNSNDEVVQCLKNINLTIKEGEVIVLCGKSGCGKTTLTRAINGLIPHFYEGELEGEVFINNTNISTQALELTAKTVGSVFQNPRSQFFNIDTTSEVVFGCENLALPKEESLERLEKVKDLFKLDALLDRSLFELSGGEKQRIAIASVYATNPDVFVFDEPSSNLDIASIELLRKAIEILVKNNKTVIIAEHRLYYLKDLATRFIYMNNGEIEHEFTQAEMKALSEIERCEMGLRSLDPYVLKSTRTITPSTEDSIRITHLKRMYGYEVALDVEKLELPLHKVIAIVGENGAGKSTFALSFSGLEKSTDRIFFQEKQLKKKERLKKSFMVMQEVGHQLFTQSVSEEVNLNTTEENEEKLDVLLESLSLSSYKDRHPMSLSGGEKQRLAVATAMYANKDFLLYDEPTSGLDYENMLKTSNLITDAAQKALASIVITHDLEFILHSCDYVIEIKKGKVARSYCLDNEKGQKRIHDYFKSQKIIHYKRKKEKTMSNILSYAGKNKKFIYSAIILLLISTICGILPFFLLNNVIVNLISGTFIWSDAITVIISIGLLLLLKVLFYGGGLGLSHLGAFKILHTIRNKFSKNMAHHSMGHIMKKGTGKYKKSFVEDISSLEFPLAHMIPEGVPYICGTLLTILAVFVADWRIGLVQLIMVPLSLLPMGLMMKASMPKIDEYYKTKDDLNSTLVEYVSGIEAIKVFNKANTSYKKLYDSVIKARDFTIDWSNLSAKYMCIVYSLLPCTLIFTVPLAIIFYVNGSLPLSSLTLVVMLGLSLSEYLLKLINFIASSTQIDFVLKQVESVFIQDDVKNGDYSEMSPDCSVEFSHVRFAYDEKEVLKDINVTIPQNTICAIVGESGSGKSTLAKLLMHFWDLEEGCIKIGNRALTDFTFENLMNHMSYVSQENTLFEGTIFDNLAIARDGITMEEVIDVCKKTSCHDFIESLEHGYNTNVGMLGNKLSGGERQRITIARAMIKNAPIVILDEATAFADAENESLIQSALSKLLVNKTVIIIAHKLHTIVNANQIIVLKEGCVEAKGTHNELLQSSQTYQKLWKISEENIEWDLGGEI